MLVRWDCAIADLEHLNVNLVREIVVSLVRACRQGHHLVVISRGIVDWLLEFEGLSQIEVSTLSRIRGDYTQNGNLHTRAATYINIVPSMAEGVSVNGARIDVSAQTFYRSNVCERPRLVVENVSRDGWVYEFILRNIRDRLGCPHVEMDLVHGGGDDIAAVFARMIDERRVVCCFVDSDKYSPKATKNSKLSKLSTVIRRAEWPLAFAMSPPCREVENLIPLDVLLSIDSAKGHGSNPILLSIVDGEINSAVDSNDLFALYFDFKEGVTSETVNKRTAADRAWIVDKLFLAGLIDAPWAIEGYGLGIVDQIKRDPTRISSFRRSVRTNDWAGSFGDFFDRAIWLFLSGRVLVT